jgi:phage-related protein
VLAFLRSIDSKKFRIDGQYRQSILARALRVFREHGWKEAAKAVVIGFLIAMSPPVSFFVAAVGLTGVAAMGTRWLANKCYKLNGPVGTALAKVADVIESVHLFLKRALDALERVVEVVIEVATNITKRVVSAGAHFASSVYQVAKSVAQDAARVVSESVSRITDKVSGWIFSWFARPALAN